MAGNKNIVPLHKTVNWKNLKDVIKETVAFINRKIYNKEQIDLNDFDLNNIACYRCEGIDLQGKNVVLSGFKGRSCFVDDNSYEVFEIPFIKNNDNKETFLMFAKNTSFEGQWIVCLMFIFNTVKNNKYYRRVQFIPIFDGSISYDSTSKHYSFNNEKRNWSLHKGTMDKSIYFDNRGIRASQYGKNYAYYLNNNSNRKDVSSKIYKKSKKKGIM